MIIGLFWGGSGQSAHNSKERSSLKECMACQAWGGQVYRLAGKAGTSETISSTATTFEPARATGVACWPRSRDQNQRQPYLPATASPAEPATAACKTRLPIPGSTYDHNGNIFSVPPLLPGGPFSPCKYHWEPNSLCQAAEIAKKPNGTQNQPCLTVASPATPGGGAHTTWNIGPTSYGASVIHTNKACPVDA